MSAAVRMRPSPSRIHCTTAPPMNTLPSSAYSVRPSDLPRDGRDQLVARRRRRRADVLQQEAAGAVGVLRHARLAAHLPEERRLLVAGDARDRHLSQARVTSTFRRRPRSTRARQAASTPGCRTDRSSSLVPGERVDVEEHRARRVADVGDVLAPPVSFQISHVSIGPEREAAGARLLACARRRGRESSGSCSPKNRRR